VDHEVVDVAAGAAVEVAGADDQAQDVVGGCPNTANVGNSSLGTCSRRSTV